MFIINSVKTIISKKLDFETKGIDGQYYTKQIITRKNSEHNNMPFRIVKVLKVCF